MKLVNYLLLILLVVSTSLGVEDVHQVDQADELHNFLLQSHGLLDHHYMDEMSAQFFLNRLELSCLTAHDVNELIGTDNTTDSFPFESFAKLAIYSLRQEECVKLENVDDIDMNETVLCRNNVSAILSDIRAHDRIELSTINPCFSAVDLIEEGCVTEKEAIDAVYIRLLTNMAYRQCILPEPGSFVDGVFSLYKENGTSLNTTEFSELLHDLGIGEIHEEEEEGHDDHADHEGEGHDDHADHEEDEEDEHAGHDHRRRKRAEDEHDHDHDDHAEHEETSKCYSSDEYISMALNNMGADSHVKELSKDGFKVICPALVQQVLSGACQPKTTEPTPPSTTTTKPEYTKAQKYGYGTLSVFIISLLAFVGLLVFKGIGNDDFNLLMQFFVALGIGTLSGDAVLHIIPEVVGLHGHGAEEVHDHEEEEDKTYLWRLLMVIGGIYLFYLFENVLKLWNQLSGSNIHFHAHPQGDECEDAQAEKNDEKSVKAATRGHRMTSFTVHKNLNAEIEEADAENGTIHSQKNNSTISTQHTELPHDKDKKIMCWGITAVGMMVWIGDALHNFGDGIALGAAFSSSWVSGVGTSIAIFCHELPHEFGDFAIYLSNGMSKWKALFMNFLAACFSFIGLYIGLSLSEHGEAREWLLAIIAGMFLYISLVDIMHEMVGEKSSRPLLQFLVQNLGLLLGWAILLLLALYEDAIISALSTVNGTS